MWPKIVAFSEQTLFKKIIDAYNTNFKELKGELVTKLVKMPWILDEIIYYIHFFSENVVMMISNLIYLSIKSKQLSWHISLVY